MNKVCVIKTNRFDYPKPPFNPDVIYPELKSLHKDIKIDENNQIFNAVRKSLSLIGMDYENFNTEKWNPFKDLVKPGEIVFIKPNMIAEKHRKNNDWDYVITNGSVIRPIIDYLFIAMKGEGRVIIGDAPQSDSKYWEIIKLMGLEEIRECYKNYRNFEIEIINLQDEYWVTKDDIHIETVTLKGDPRGSVLFNLKELSYFSEFDNHNIKYYGAGYNIDETNNAHKNGDHKYYIAKSPILADVFINIPKLKTHKKCGITVNLKSLVGINANKNYLPHYIFGDPSNKGDQFDHMTIKRKVENFLLINVKKYLSKKNKIIQYLARKFKSKAYDIFGDTDEVIRSGNWYGNDTVWRMSLDLNKILMYGSFNGEINSKRKRYFSIVDGIKSMEGNGPVAGTCKNTGLIISGFDPVAVDCVCATLMGFDYKKIKLITRAFDKIDYRLTDQSAESLEIVSNNELWNGKKIMELDYHSLLHFKPHFGWAGQIELENKKNELQ